MPITRLISVFVGSDASADLSRYALSVDLFYEMCVISEENVLYFLIPKFAIKCHDITRHFFVVVRLRSFLYNVIVSFA